MLVGVEGGFGVRCVHGYGGCKCWEQCVQIDQIFMGLVSLVNLFSSLITRVQSPLISFLVKPEKTTSFFILFFNFIDFIWTPKLFFYFLVTLVKNYKRVLKIIFNLCPELFSVGRDKCILYAVVGVRTRTPHFSTFKMCQLQPLGYLTKKKIINFLNEFCIFFKRNDICTTIL